jgi:NAD-dependent SIR2 family protein deacetylase
MKEIILLGAGASVEAGVPAAYDMTKSLIELLGGTPKHGHIVKFVVGGLLMQKGVKDENPFEGVNVEEVFSAIELLANRENIEAAPFIGSWHRLVEELDLILPEQPRSSSAEGGRHSVKIPIRRTKRQRLFSLTQSQPGEGKSYKEVNDVMIHSLRKLVLVENPKKVEYLLPMLQTKTQSNLTIATLNYDNTVELAAKSLGKDVQTGIIEWSKSGSFPKFDKGVCLLKLHGSIDWISLPKRSRLSQDNIVVLPSDELGKDGYFKPVVVFGQRNKLTAEGPFLDLLRAFEEKLKEADRLTVIGYSFRDDHINEQIRKWLNNAAGMIRIINNKEFPSTTIPFARTLINLKERVEVLDLGAKDGIAKCFSTDKGNHSSPPRKSTQFMSKFS